MNKHPKKIIISPPFGTHIRLKNATSVKGSFTFMTRPGKWKHIFKTLRYTKDGWVNRVGLRAGGVYNMSPDDFDDVSALYSFAAVDNEDWHLILEWIQGMGVTDIMVELNVSCPNIKNKGIPTEQILKRYAETFPFVSIKLPPHDIHLNHQLVKTGLNAGISTYHFCNTYPTDRGGLSGKKVKEHSLTHINIIKIAYPEISIIGGGGIYTPQDVIDYHNVGADYFSLATIWFTPWRVPAVIRKIESLQ